MNEWGFTYGKTGKNLMMLFKITWSFGKHFHTLKVSYTMSYRLLHKLWVQGDWRQALVHQKLC